MQRNNSAGRAGTWFNRCRTLNQQRLRPERGAQFRLCQGYGETSPKLKERRQAPRESERGWGPASIEE